MNQQLLDKSNAEFWATLCGTTMARGAGITGQDPGDLRRFDDVYFDYYPYLERYLLTNFDSEKVLEIGLGYGTLGQAIASRNADYHGVDISTESVALMRTRLRWLGLPETPVREGSALELPYPDEAFERVYSIGCLHHTGNLTRSVDEVYRVLRPGGEAVVMVYNRRSLRRLAFAARRWAFTKSPGSGARLARRYDADESGNLAPHTDFVSKTEAKRLFARFDRVRIDVQNFGDYRPWIKREWLLGNIARVLGLDLYIVATK